MYNRPIKGIFTAFFKKQFYLAFLNIFRYFQNPVEVFLKYVFRFGSYPREFRIKTPIGAQRVTLFCSDDIITLVECFGKLDYCAGKNIACVIDFGSNIGISGLYFLTRNTTARVYLHEPLPRNINRLKENLTGFEGRYALDPVAVGLDNGTSLFGCEPTGRYGGLNKSEMKDQIEVEVRCANEIIQEILTRHEKIDILKLDIEGLEEDLIKNLSPGLLNCIDRIYAETETEFKGELKGFKKEQYGAIARFYKLKTS